jgi:hypothetical protein
MGIHAPLRIIDVEGAPGFDVWTSDCRQRISMCSVCEGFPNRPSMPEMTLQRCSDTLVQNAAWRAVLLAGCIVLGACSDFATPREDIPASGPDPTYGKAVATFLKGSFKDLSPNDVAEISGPRWIQSYTGWNWLVCVHFQDRGNHRTYAVFFRGNAIVDARYAVVTDACHAQSYSPFDLGTGAFNLPAAAIAGPGPLY